MKSVSRLIPILLEISAPTTQLRFPVAFHPVISRSNLVSVQVPRSITNTRGDSSAAFTVTNSARRRRSDPGLGSISAPSSFPCGSCCLFGSAHPLFDRLISLAGFFTPLILARVSLLYLDFPFPYMFDLFVSRVFVSPPRTSRPQYRFA